MAQSASEVLVLPAQTGVPASTLSSISFSRPISIPRSSGPSTMKRSQKYPAPINFPPISGQHKQTFIVLHGRGSTNRRFAPCLLDTDVPLPVLTPESEEENPASPKSQPPSPSCFNVNNLQTLLPHTRFVFPGASSRPIHTSRHSSVTQWFDMNPLTEPTENEHLMNEGLKETTEYLHGLIEREARLVGGAHNVIIGGLSQGCASSLIATLLWKGEPLRAFVGMAGWLPFREHLESIAKSERQGWVADFVSASDSADDREENPFEAPSEDGCGTAESHPTSPGAEDRKPPPQQQAIRELRDELDMSRKTSSKTTAAAENVSLPFTSLGRTPVFLGHGKADPKVPVQLGGEAASCLKALGFDVQLEEYKDLGHWYSGDMLRDVIAFLGRVSSAKQAISVADEKKTDPNAA